MIYSEISSHEAYSVSQFIALKDTDEVTYYNTSINNYIPGGIQFAIHNVLYDYEEEIQQSTVLLNLSDNEMTKYRFKPWLLSYDIYGSTELEFIIRMLNGYLQDYEFDFQKIKVLRPNVLSNIIGRIISANSQFLFNNQYDMKKLIKTDDKDMGIW